MFKNKQVETRSPQIEDRIKKIKSVLDKAIV